MEIKEENALDSLKQDLESLSLKHLDGATPPRLYHYTDTRGLLGILDSQQLWATHAFYLNDATELDIRVNWLRKFLAILKSK